MASNDIAEYSKRELGDAARKHVMELLSWDYPFAKAVMKSVDFSDSKVFSFVPDSLGVEKVHDITTGGLMDPKVTEPFLEKYILEFLSRGKDKIVVFKDACASKSDSCIPSFESNIFFHDGHVFHFLRNQDAEIDQVRLHIDWSKSGVCNLVVCTSLPDGIALEKGQDVSQETLDVLAKRTEVIIRDAYDLDGHLYLELSAL